MMYALRVAGDGLLACGFCVNLCVRFIGWFIVSCYIGGMWLWWWMLLLVLGVCVCVCWLLWSLGVVLLSSVCRVVVFMSIHVWDVVFVLSV